jgi:hypothetical protein
MHFANAPSWWLALLVAAAVAGATVLSYARPLVALSPGRRLTLASLRMLALSAVALFLARPILLTPPPPGASAAVPIVVDVSRSMRVADADGQARMARAAALVARELVPALKDRFTPDIYTAGDALTPAPPDRFSADARHSDLAGALHAVRERYRGRPVSGIVIVSDGGDTTGELTGAEDGPPVFAVGVGSPDGIKDREVLGITAGDPRLDQASVDLHVSASSAHYGRAPFELRVLANGRLVESRRVALLADGSPIDETFTVSPDPLNATVYTAEIPNEPDEIVTENNARSVLVSPAGRKRRVLVLAGAPGFEHSFLARALAMDSGLEVDAVVRKGRNENGEGTFLVQAGQGRGQALTSGFPSTREALYAYDALIIANVEGDFFTRAQLAQAAEFASERGGGLLVLGGRSFAPRGLIGTPLEAALPVELNDRRGLNRSMSVEEGAEPGHNTISLTPEGEKHPVTRIGSSLAETRRLWSALPPLAASATLGGPRPGAAVLAVTAAPTGAVYPVVAVQRFGRGRSMVFAGEASWRWRMMLPAADRSYEFFWRQAVRWLAGSSPDPVTIEVPEAAEPGDSVDVHVDARDRAFLPVADAVVQAALTVPGGETKMLALRHEAGASGRYTAAVRFDQPGLYRVRVDARRGAATLGESDRWLYVGGGDREFADPRLNEGWLRRVARASGGRYVRTAEASQIASWLQTAVLRDVEPAQRDLWHEPWAFALVVALLSAEWVLRRRWGLR